MSKFGMTGRTIAATVLLAGASVAIPTTASASVAPRSCGTDPFISVDSYGTPYYKPIGNTAGKYNASSSTATLRYSLTTTTSRSTSWSIGGSASLSWGIGQVEATVNRTLTKTTSRGVSFTDTLNVPGRSYGYVTPKVEYRRFNIRKEHYGPNCRVVVNKDYGVIDVIWAYPFYSECVSRHSCTPKP